MTGIEYNSILTVIDQYIKQGYFILFLEEIGAEETVYIFYRYIIANYRILEEMITDRDTRFKSKFWQELIVLAESRSKLSTVFYL